MLELLKRRVPKTPLMENGGDICACGEWKRSIIAVQPSWLHGFHGMGSFGGYIIFHWQATCSFVSYRYAADTSKIPVDTLKNLRDAVLLAAIGEVYA